LKAQVTWAVVYVPHYLSGKPLEPLSHLTTLVLKSQPFKPSENGIGYHTVCKVHAEDGAEYFHLVFQAHQMEGMAMAILAECHESPGISTIIFSNV
jgi:hypothetical protein